ncbi:MAG: hypothetical protein PHD37_06580 [Gallionellaceae bacterium]|nr:hypothetical protein [Gallionellaceae bacterium]
MKFIKMWKSLNTFQTQYRPIAALVWLFSILLSVILFFPTRWADLWIPAFASLAIVFPLLAMLSRDEATLSRRIEAGNAVPWSVDVNGVIVGTIADSHYAAIQLSVWLDARTHIAQLLNVGNMGSRIVDMLFVGIPLGVFWYGFGVFFLAPDTFASILAELRQVTPEQVASSVPRLLQMVGLISMMFILARIALGKSFGFVNHFDKAIGKHVRLAIGCAAEGDVYLHRHAGETAIASSEMGSIRPHKA